MDAKWDATMDDRNLGEITRPDGTTTVTDAVGLLNIYEYQSSNNGGTDGYLNNGLHWWTLTPYNTSDVHYVFSSGQANNSSPTIAYRIRPSLNLKSNVVITERDGTKENPFTVTLGS